MKRSFQWELTVFTAFVSGVILFVFLGASWWLMQRQFESSVDGKMEIPGERLIGILGPDTDLLELLVEYSNRSAEHEFHVIVYGNDGDHWYTSPGAEWIEEIDHTAFLPDSLLVASIPLPGGRPPGRAGPPPGRRGERRGPRGASNGFPPRRPIAPMVFAPHVRADGSRWRLGGISNRDVTVIMALNLADFDDEIQRARTGFLLAVPIALVALMGGGWLVSQRAIRPLRRVTRTANRWSVADLSHRIEASGNEPSEFAELIDVLNDMMERLERGFTQARRFAADASHELKTPVALIQAGIEDALSECRASKGDPESLMGVSGEVRRLKGILEGLLLLSRADAGQLRVSDESLDLSAEVALFCEDIEFLSAEKLINAKVTIEPKVSVQGDRIMLGQFIQNLLGNALKYNEESGRLWCVLREESGEAILDVGNSGPGIPEGESDRIFDRFYRADKARSRKVDGVGLGLNIALEIVRAHRGDLILVQADEDATVFRMRLPLV
ncbi:ATP-binding protein [bacterium]|nr:ATP-binding protein [bacterium]